MFKQGIAGFPYFLGIDSLADIAAASDRVCILNILGGESRQVTPVSHAYSGGNVVFGTSPGRSGQSLPTPAGPIPVFNSVLEGLKAGLRFNTGVVYLPPAGVRDGVAELVRVNPDLRKIVIVTEKVSVHDAREIRAIAQTNGIDVFGANSLGVADSWNRVRIGGALGGDHPDESLLKGSLALYSNSGNFTTTIAQYLATAGWGTTTLISSGKDVYIHYAAREFVHALAKDRRSKGAVLYLEPGGYYEKGLSFSKPTVVCVVGRWKAKLTRAVGHAGAMAGGGDSAEAKERWLMEAFGVDALFSPEAPVCSEKGAVVRNIAHIPDAVHAVMQRNGIAPDFAPRGDLELKPWFAGGQGFSLPEALDLPAVSAIEPYGEQIRQACSQLGASFPRQAMKDASGASVMDRESQVTRVHGHSVLDLALEPLEASFALPLVHEIADRRDRALLDIAVAGEANLVGDPVLEVAEEARRAGNAPNIVMAAAVSIIGPNRVERAQRLTRALIDGFDDAGLADAHDESFDLTKLSFEPETLSAFLAADDEDSRRPAVMLRAARERGASSVFLRFLESLRHPLCKDAVLAAIAATIAWGPLKRKRISRLTAESLPWYLRLYGVMFGAAIPGRHHQVGSLFGVPSVERFQQWTMADLAFFSITGKRPEGEQARLLHILIGLLISNGPGAISAQGAKGAVAADGPQTPARVQINKCMVGFLTHTGFAHGGNGFEGVAFLLERFANSGLRCPKDPNHGLPLREMALAFARAFKDRKRQAKEQGLSLPGSIPGVHHPVFRGQAVNYDPRERFIAALLERRAEYNVFHAFYLELVAALHDVGASPYVFCVNIDAVIASMLLALLWEDYRAGRLSDHDLETAAFTIFLFGRMIGAAAEIDDHINRGRDMDTRTPASQCRFVS